MSRLGRGDLLPDMRVAPPGPRSRELCETLERVEAPVVNTICDGRASIVWEEALGCIVADVDGNRYLDLVAGFGAAAVGHRHPRVVEAIQSQAEKLLHGLGDVHAHPGRVRLAEELCRMAPLDEAVVYFAVSGSDAVEIALKTALLYNGRPSTLAFSPAYHGLTLGALSVSSRPEFRAPFDSMLRKDVHHLPFACPRSEIDGLLGRDPDIGCAIVEPIVGREGILVPPPGWLSELGRACRAHGVVLIVDEIFTGFGRTGSLFVSEEEDLEPDLLCCGKALGGGLPIAAVLGRRHILDAWQSDGEALHTATFLANPIACEAALAVLEILTDEGLVERARLLGHEVSERLTPWAGSNGVVEVRGRGLLWGVELESRQRASTVCALALERGVLLLATGPEGRVLEISPALTISREQLRFGLTVVEEALFADVSGPADVSTAP